MSDFNLNAIASGLLNNIDPAKKIEAQKAGQLVDIYAAQQIAQGWNTYEEDSHRRIKSLAEDNSGNAQQKTPQGQKNQTYQDNLISMQKQFGQVFLDMSRKIAHNM